MKVLIVGLGSIALKHITALRNIEPSIQIYALRSSENAKINPWVTNIYSLTEPKGIKFDFAIISNPTSAHKEAIHKLIPLKIPLFIEKPLFSELGHEQVLQKIKKNEIVTYVACNLRFLDALKFIKTYIKDKRINEVNIYCGSYLPDWRPGTDFRKGYSAHTAMGGGVHIDLIHEIDYAFWLFGKPLRVSRYFSSKSSLMIDAIDYANFVLGFAGFNVSVVLNYYRKDAKRSLEIVCDTETLTIDLLKNSVYSNQNLIFKSEKTILDTYEDQLRFFINEIVKKEMEFNPAQEAYQILEICLQND